MSYRLINANALNGVISNDDYEKVLNAPYIFADLPNGLDGEHYNLKEENDCRDCKEYKDCPCGEDGHKNGTSQGYSTGECKDFKLEEPEEEPTEEPEVEEPIPARAPKRRVPESEEL